MLGSFCVVSTFITLTALFLNDLLCEGKKVQLVLSLFFCLLFPCPFIFSMPWIILLSSTNHLSRVTWADVLPYLSETFSSLFCPVPFLLYSILKKEVQKCIQYTRCRHSLGNHHNIMIFSLSVSISWSVISTCYFVDFWSLSQHFSSCIKGYL